MSSRRLLIGFALLALTTLSASGADDKVADSKAAGLAVTMEVVIAELKAPEKAELALGVGASDKSIADRLKQLAAQGHVGLITQTRMTSLHKEEALIQIGETTPAVSGRTSRGVPANGFGGGGGGAGTGGGFPASTVYTMVSTGTMIRATPSCEEGGGVVVNLKIERTRLLPKSKADGAAEVEPQQTVTLTANSTVRIPAGQTVLVSGSRSVTNEQATELLILVSAQVGSGK